MNQKDDFVFKVTPGLLDEIGGHIPNYVMPRWFEEARTPLWQKVTALCSEGVQFGTVRHSTFDFRREVRGGAEVTVITSVRQIGNSSVECQQEAWQHGQLAVFSTSVLVAIDTTSRTKVNLGSEARLYLNRLLNNHEA